MSATWISSGVSDVFRSHLLIVACVIPRGGENAAEAWSGRCRVGDGLGGVQSGQLERGLTGLLLKYFDVNVFMPNKHCRDLLFAIYMK